MDPHDISLIKYLVFLLVNSSLPGKVFLLVEKHVLAAKVVSHLTIVEFAVGQIFLHGLVGYGSRVVTDGQRVLADALDEISTRFGLLHIL